MFNEKEMKNVTWKCLFRPVDCRVTTKELTHTLLFISTQKQENVKESG